MMDTKYAVVVMEGCEPGLLRFLDSKNQIQAGKKLPDEFRATLYGLGEWRVIAVLPERTAQVLEGIALLLGTERVRDVTEDIFNAGKLAGVREVSGGFQNRANKIELAAI